MKITIESTATCTTLDGVRVRVWEGVTEKGVRCHVFVHRVAVRDDLDTKQFERELAELLPPADVPLGKVLP
jgi:hypothetical protein